MIKKIGINFKKGEERDSRYEIFLAECSANSFIKLVEKDYSHNNEYDKIVIKGSKKHKIKRKEELFEYSSIIVKGNKNDTSKTIAAYYFLDNVSDLNGKKTYGVKITDTLSNLDNILKNELEELMDILTFSREELIFTLGLIDNTEDEIYISYRELKNNLKSATDYFMTQYVPFRFDSEIKDGFNLKTSIPSLIRMDADFSWLKCQISKIRRLKDEDSFDIFKRKYDITELLTCYYASLPKEKIGIFEVENKDNLLDEDIIEDFIIYLHFCIS